jgi:hypothetical protein
MILHSTSMLVILAGETAQTPTHVQCILQMPSDPWWKWLLQFVLSVIPVAGGVLIAVWSFRRSRQTEHEQWIRDQKKAEWSCLLRSVANVYQITNSVGGWNRKFADRIVSELEPALNEVSIARANCVFVNEFRLNNEGCKKTMEFLRFAAIQLQKIRGNLGLFDSINDRIKTAGSATDQDNKSRLRTSEIVLSEVSDLAEQSSNLLAWLQNEAALDLIQTAEGEEHWAMRWKKRFNFARKKTGS